VVAQLTGKTALVTGAANGIGRAIALRFVQEGAAVVFADCLEDAANAAADSADDPTRAMGVMCDVSDSSSVRECVDATINRFGTIDVVVSGAAVFSPVSPLADLTESDWQLALSVNLTGAFHVCKHAIPVLHSGGGGSIILIASQMARVANAGQAAYCATKGALVQLAKGIALDYVDSAIRANTLSPGGIATNRLVQRFGDLETAQRQWGPKHPMGRLGEPEEIANGAVFLASDESSFMTGADLLLDGGYTAW
jgi:NAD(P)-dependent dehydrogenase (short-subunit alcohol dehydrogenase family)